MPNPWDRPPLPKRGDEHEDITFAHVGRIMNQWERIEFGLSRLYSWFGGSFDDLALFHEYGKGRIFRERADSLRRKANEYFLSRPDQALESAFDQLFEQASGYANRRNDIAHGILFQIDKIEFFRERLKPALLTRAHFAIIPPLYAFRFADENGFAEFAYTSTEMQRLALRMEKVAVAARAIYNRNP